MFSWISKAYTPLYSRNLAFDETSNRHKYFIAWKFRGHFNFAVDRKYRFSRHFNFVVVRKNRFSRHFNFAVFRPRPRNREIFMPRNFHSIKYYINTRNFLHTYGLGDVACASSILLSFLKVNLNLVLSILNLINFVILFL